MPPPALVFQPAIKVGRNELIIRELGIKPIDTVYRLSLARTQILVGINAKAPFQESLASEYFMATRDNASETIGHIEESGVAVGNGAIQRKQPGGYRCLGAGSLAIREQGDRGFCPDGPVTEQAADKAKLTCFRAKRNQEVKNDMVVVARVEGYTVARARGRDPPYHIERRVTIERGDLDPNDIFNTRETLPEPRRQRHSPNRRLQVKAHERHFLRDSLAVFDQFVFAGAL